MDTKNNTPTANPLEVAVRDLCGKVDAYLKQGCTRSELYHVNERVKALLDTLPEQEPENFNSAFDKYMNEVDLEEHYKQWLEEYIEQSEGYYPTAQAIAHHFAEWGASHAVAPHYFKLRELKTGRVFLAEWSDIAGEWYERGDGKAYQSNEVEIIPRDRKTPTP